jgi:hypothetical protein
MSIAAQYTYRQLTMEDVKPLPDAKLAFWRCRMATYFSTADIC